MIKIEDNTVYLTRGDTLLANVEMTRPDGTEYIPQEGDAIRFAMKRSFKSGNVILRKDINIYGLMLIIDPADTSNLDFGHYVYDIQLTRPDGTVDTFISGDLYLTPEVD